MAWLLHWLWVTEREPGKQPSAPHSFLEKSKKRKKKTCVGTPFCPHPVPHTHTPANRDPPPPSCPLLRLHSDRDHSQGDLRTGCFSYMLVSFQTSWRKILTLSLLAHNSLASRTSTAVSPGWNGGVSSGMKNRLLRLKSVNISWTVILRETLKSILSRTKCSRVCASLLSRIWLNSQCV